MGFFDRWKEEGWGNKKMTQIVKIWNKFGFWQYSCGCIQYQDRYELCSKHKPGGYMSLMEENILEEPRTAAGSLD